MSNETQKHTPGPWKPSKFGSQVVTGDSWSTICELRGGAEWEDGRGKYEQEYEWQNQKANARIIAAAPDMREALKPFEEHARERVADDHAWRESDTVSLPIRIDELRAVLAAIAKAEG